MITVNIRKQVVGLTDWRPLWMPRYLRDRYPFPIGLSHLPQTRRRGHPGWIDPNLIAGRKIKDKHRFVVIAPKEINALGIATRVPVIRGGQFARALAVPIIVFVAQGRVGAGYVFSRKGKAGQFYPSGAKKPIGRLAPNAIRRET
jgi:hypothetical protein